MSSPNAVDALTKATAALRIPLYGMIELTWRCNFRCVHCYQEGQRDSHRELSTEEWRQLLDELAVLGCVFLNITGGEPLLRKDFPDIYRHAIGRGFVVTVFSNASLITQDILALWAQLPPRKVEISLYGTNAETYRRVTGVSDGWEKAVSAVDRLCALGIRVELKAPAMKLLLDELTQMRTFARQRGLSFRADPGLFPRLDGNRAPLEQRLSPAEVLALEAADSAFQERLQACFMDVPDLGTRVYRCGAGSNAFNINPSGHFEACAIARATSVSWREVGAARAWEALRAESERVHAWTPKASLVFPSEGSKPEGCGSCAARGGCSRCPGKSWLEAGDVEKAVPHHCEVTVKKREALELSSA